MSETPEDAVGLEQELQQVAAEIEQRERQLSVLRSRRDDRIQQATTAGLSERQAASLAGVSPSYAHLAKVHGRYARVAPR